MRRCTLIRRFVLLCGFWDLAFTTETYLFHSLSTSFFVMCIIRYYYKGCLFVRFGNFLLDEQDLRGSLDCLQLLLSFV